MLLENDSGLTYEGEFCQDLRHGQGTLTNKSGSYLYEGQWMHGVKHGQGQLWTDKSKYSGGFRDDQFWGTGSLVDENGDLYEGDFVNGVMEGAVTILTKEGNKFLGEYKAGKKEGPGQWEYSNGTLSNGIFQNGEMNGNGVKFYDKERAVRYEGEFKDDKPGGKGTYFTPDGEKITALWERGKVIPNDITLPEFTTPEGETSLWTELDDEIRDKILSVEIE